MFSPENTFLDRARYPKGRKTLQAILDATYELIIAEGPTAASQKAIAERANVTQSAVRHYFPTKEDLLVAFFSTGIERLQSLLRAKLAEVCVDPRRQLLEIAALHYSRISEVDNALFFETMAFWRRNPQYSEIRDRWYADMCRCYQQLIQQMHPDWAETRCVEAAFQVLTLILGGWVTAGHSRPMYKERTQAELTAALLRGVERLID
ncbi:TetR/AcrR family transcriptional regulator [Pseudomonas sp. N040]|uniref:TetR/AcrR family transcriptional regulator n=1 Tax=Pseudomonas sp. N040 TaxID=2785325 RepID=UPI0018A265D8|nr:TetR/AcrR family transcriptional regulator [Pseudomonas sp. N040]MBF7731557.1 TetR/AcrR family transcriptional regulator [Pseudomonas sp. N040]MBW7015201.1 TetR/AcrR family transcriptional regulator [Pseudomonas sp. N040]